MQDWSWGGRVIFFLSSGTQTICPLLYLSPQAFRLWGSHQWVPAPHRRLLQFPIVGFSSSPWARGHIVSLPLLHELISMINLLLALSMKRCIDRTHWFCFSGELTPAYISRDFVSRSICFNLEACIHGKLHHLQWLQKHLPPNEPLL